jgi:hypothetical protein
MVDALFGTIRVIAEGVHPALIQTAEAMRVSMAGSADALEKERMGLVCQPVGTVGNTIVGT